MVVDPWAKIIKSAKEGEEIIVADLGTAKTFLAAFLLILLMSVNFFLVSSRY